MFARCCEQKIAVMSESMSQLRFTRVWTIQPIIDSKDNNFHLHCMNNLSLKNISSLLKNWAPRKIFRSEMTTETITNYQFFTMKIQKFGQGVAINPKGALANKIQIFM